MSFDPPDGYNHGKPYYNDVGELITPNSGAANTPTGWTPYIPYTIPNKGVNRIYGQNADYYRLQDMQPELPKIKCTCGTSITLGASQDHWEFHSSYCDCYKEQRIK